MVAATGDRSGNDPETEESDGAGDRRPMGVDLRRHLARLLRGPSTPPPTSGASPRSIRKAIDQLDERERRLSLAAALASVAFAALIYISEIHSPTFEKLHHLTVKGQLQPQTTLILGLAAGALLLVATYVGRRAFVAFVCLFAFFIFSNGSSSVVVGVPFAGLGGWLLYRSFKTQRQMTAELRSGGTSRPASRSGATATREPKSRSTSGQSKPASRSKGGGRPEANKRYTPKRPPPPAPKPSRRERKAAQPKE